MIPQICRPRWHQSHPRPHQSWYRAARAPAGNRMAQATPMRIPWIFQTRCRRERLRLVNKGSLWRLLALEGRGADEQ